MMRMLYWLIGLAAALTACAFPAPATSPALHPVTTNTLQPIPPQPKRTATPSLIPPTPLPSPPPSATPILHPMSITALRGGNYPGSDIEVVRELERGANYRRYYVYYLSEGLKIYALLTIPNGETPPGGWPGIVFNHGYIPPDVYRTTERYIAYVDQLARNGYVVFRIDYRGHDQSEGEARGAYGHPGYLVDVLNAVTSLQRHPQVNPQKIGMWGHSMGGFLTLRAMVTSDQVKAGVIWAGVVASYPDMLYNWRSRPFTPRPGFTSWRSGWIEEFGTPEQNPTFWNAISANSYLSDLSGPLQLHHGTEDEDVPLAFSVRLAEQARQAGQTAELYIYEGDNHNISRYFSTAMARTIAFFDSVLK